MELLSEDQNHEVFTKSLAIALTNPDKIPDLLVVISDATD
jgi:hypothetical protein